MSYLCFYNPGEIDPRAFTLMGASVKDGDGVIGFFGSGNKYAIAALFRHGVKFRVFSGTREIHFTLDRQTFRNEPFDVVVIDGVPTSITTRTGPKWEVLDAVRELYSNAHDEGGGYLVTSASVMLEGTTRIYLEITPRIEEILNNWNSYFSHTATILNTSFNGTIISQPGLFRRNIWIADTPEIPYLFGYNFDEFDLPESRKIHHNAARYDVGDLLGMCTSEVVWRELLSYAKDGSQCQEFYSIPLCRRSNEETKQVLVKCLHDAGYHYIATTDHRKFIRKVEAETLFVSSPAYDFFTVLGAPTAINEPDAYANFEELTMTQVHQDKLDAALAALEAKNIVFPPTTFKLVKFFDDRIFGQANMKAGECYLAEKAFPILTKVLIEEWTHLFHRVSDNTVEQQHVYLDLIVGLINNDPSVYNKSAIELPF